MARLLLELATSDEDQLKDALEVLQQHPTQSSPRDYAYLQQLYCQEERRLNAEEFHTIKRYHCDACPKQATEDHAPQEQELK